MATKSISTRSTRKAPLTSKILRRVSEAATKAASKAAFDVVETYKLKRTRTDRADSGE